MRARATDVDVAVVPSNRVEDHPLPSDEATVVRVGPGADPSVRISVRRADVDVPEAGAEVPMDRGVRPRARRRT
jgi:hypothetical protein